MDTGNSLQKPLSYFTLTYIKNTILIFLFTIINNGNILGTRRKNTCL